MYSPIIISRNLEVAQRTLDEDASSPRFTLTPSSLAKSIAYTDHFNSLINTDLWREKRIIEFRDPSRTLGLEERQWIRNEQIYSTLDYTYFASRYVFIDAWEKGLSRYIPNKAQRILNQVRAEMEEQYKAIFLLLLKARQEGMSTDVEVSLLHRALFHADSKILIASSKEGKTDELFKKFTLGLEHVPWFLLPEYELTTTGEERFISKRMRSNVKLQWGNQKGGVGRGETPRQAHLCISPDTLIPISNGLTKPIREVKIGDYVKTSLGRYSKVKDVGVTPWRKAEVASKITLWSNPYPLITTKDHPILTPDGFREAALLTKGDKVSIAVRPIHNVSAMESFTLTSRPRGGSRYGSTVKQEIIPDREWGWFFGLYLAEGCIERNSPERDKKQRPGRFTLALHEKEIDEVLPRLSALIKKPISVRPTKDSKTVALRFSHNGLAAFVKDNFYTEGHKTIPDWAWLCGREFCEGIVEGYIFGDGYLTPNKNDVIAVSICLPLLLQLRDLIASLGWGWSSLYNLPAGLRYGRNCQESWRLLACGITGKNLRQGLGWTYTPFTPVTHQHWNWGKDNKFIDIKIKEVEEELCNEFWYLTVLGGEHDFTTIQCCIMNTEIPDWLDPKEDIQNSLMKGIHPQPETYFVEESTAKYKGDYWESQWLDASEFYSRGESYFFPLFLPWYVADDIYPTSTWIRDFPVPTNWHPPEIVIAQKLRAEQYVHATPRLRKIMGEHWTMPLHQMWFWHFDRELARREKRLNTWVSEMPASAKEAFNVRGTSVFDTEKLHDLRNKARFPLATFAIEGSPEEIPARLLLPDESDLGLPPIPVYAEWGSYTSQFLLRPLHIKDFETLDPHGKLILWELPLPEEHYYIVVDCGLGLGQDRTIIYVLRKGDIDRPDEQVAEYASPFVSGEDLWPLLMCVASYFSVQRDGVVRQSQICIELAQGGASCQARMMEHGWSNFYIHIPLASKHKDASKYSTIGWNTNRASREAALTEFITDVRNDDIQINSPWLLDEMQTFGLNERTRKLEALGAGTHDDRVMGAAIGSFCAHVFERRSGRESTAARRAEQQRKRDEAQRKTQYSMGDMARPVRATGYNLRGEEYNDSY